MNTTHPWPTSTDLQTAYATQVIPVGSIAENPRTGQRAVFLKYVSSTDAVANECVTISDYDAFEVKRTVTLADVFAGARPDGAGAISENEWGWFIVHGEAELLEGASCNTIVANGGAVVIDDDTDGGRIGGIDIDVATPFAESNVDASLKSLANSFGRAVDASTGTADTELTVYIHSSAWDHLF